MIAGALPRPVRSGGPRLLIVIFGSEAVMLRFNLVMPGPDPSIWFNLVMLGLDPEPYPQVCIGQDAPMYLDFLGKYLF